jgi:hypothetical protein
MLLYIVVGEVSIFVDAMKGDCGVSKAVVNNFNNHFAVVFLILEIVLRGQCILKNKLSSFTVNICLYISSVGFVPA